MLTGILLVITPVIVSTITNIVKKLPTFKSLTGSSKPAIRLLAAIVSFLYITLGLWIEPSTVSDDMISTSATVLGLSVVTWLSSIGVYKTFFKRK